jgi:hypothetical protein
MEGLCGRGRTQVKAPDHPNPGCYRDTWRIERRKA